MSVVVEERKATSNHNGLHASVETPRASRWTGSAAMCALLVLAALHAIYFARELLLPIAAAYFFKLVLTPLVRWLRRGGVPEPLGATLVLGVALTMGAFSAYQLIGPANDWIARAPKILQQASAQLGPLREPVENLNRAAEQVEEMTTTSSRGRVAVRGPSLTSLLLQSTSNFLATVVATLVLLFLWLATGDHIMRKAFTILPQVDDKAALALSRELEHTVSNYCLTVSLINVGLGLATGFAMHWLGMPNPYLWGMMVAILNFVPYVGALASLIILSLAAYVTFDDLGRALLVGGVYFALNAAESYLVTPSILGRRMSMNPVAIFIAMMLFGWAWGVYGLLLAVPLLSAFKVVCEHLEPLHDVAELVSA
jgi:predicted PurR-regulated permease PerM